MKPATASTQDTPVHGMHRRHRGGVLLLALAPFAPALAQVPPCTDDARCLDVVQVTATRRPESTLQVPAATTLVGGEALRATAPQTPMDALHGEVGTFVQQTTPGQGVVIVRGLKGSEVLHLVDGFRLNNAIFRNAPNQYIALVDGQSLDRIEVVRGPSGTLYGGDAMGGVVHMRTPDLAFDGTEWQWRGRVRAIASSADDMRLGRVQVEGGREGFALSAGTTWQDVGDLRIGGGRVLPFSGMQQRNGDLRLQAAVGERHTVVLQAQWSEQPKTPRHDALVPGFGQVNPETSVFFFEPQRRAFTQLRWRIDGGTWFDHAELRVGRQRIDDDRRTREFGASNEDRERNRVTTTGVTADFGKDFGPAHRLDWGAEFYRDDVRAARTRTNLATGATSVRAPRFPDGSRMDGWGVYAAHDWRDGRWDVTTGLRYSRFTVTLPGSGSVPGVRLAPDDLSGHIGASFEATDALRLVANLGRGFRAPNVFDLGVFGPRPGNRYSVPNPDLSPERVTTLDAGLKFGGERLSAELIAYRSWYRDKITSVLTGDTVGSALVVQNRNVTALDLWGVEAGVRAWLPAPRVTLHATATWTRGDEDTATGTMPADRIPPLFGKLSAAWQATDRVELEAYVFYATRQGRLSSRDAIDPRINPRGTAGWGTFNVRVAWRATDALAFALRAENLADKNYREHGSGLDEPGRNAILTLDYRF